MAAVVEVSHADRKDQTHTYRTEIMDFGGMAVMGAGLPDALEGRDPTSDVEHVEVVGKTVGGHALIHLADPNN